MTVRRERALSGGNDDYKTLKSSALKVLKEHGRDHGSCSWGGPRGQLVIRTEVTMLSGTLII